MFKQAAFTGVLCMFSVFIILSAAEAEASRRTKRSIPIVNHVYALDHFIELVEKIERNVSSLSFYHLVNHIHHLGSYSDSYWSTILRPSTSLPDGILNSVEKHVLKNMVAHRYEGSRELGVVRTSSGETIAIGHVINGIFAGYVRNRRTSLTKWSPEATKTIDNLYGATISRDLAQATLAKMRDSSLPYFGPSGSWDDNKCLTRYTRSSGVTTEASNAELLGDIDGFLLGYHLAPWIRKKVRLGQLFRMYYSTGICYDMSVASCKRFSKFKSIVDVESLQEQVAGLAEAIYLKNSTIYPNVKKEDIFDATTPTTQQFFPYVENINGSSQTCPEKPEGCELSANLVILMDESGSIKPNGYINEKKFVRQIIDAFEISPFQTKVAVVEFSNDPYLAINLHDYGSKTRLSCAINTLGYKGGSTYMDKALRLAKDQIFLPAQKENSRNKRDASNILILLTDGKASNKPAFVEAVQEIKAEVKDLTMLAVGVSNYIYSELQLIATDPQKHVFTAVNFDHLLDIVKGLQNRTCKTPSKMDLNFQHDENNTFITAFVSPGKVRYFELAPKYFYGLSDILIQIKPVYGSLSTYASRVTDTPGPGNYSMKIDPIPIGLELGMHIIDPCSGYNSTTCPPIYLAIWANEASCACIEPECTTPNQIKFTIRKGGIISGVRQIRGSIFLTVIGLALLHLM